MPIPPFPGGRFVGLEMYSDPRQRNTERLIMSDEFMNRWWLDKDGKWQPITLSRFTRKMQSRIEDNPWKS